MIVLSAQSLPLAPPAVTVRANCTGSRIGIASGKKRANPATLLAFCALRADAVPS
jgi:hypothetical protein